MRRVFADTFYYFALINEKDDAHLRALEFSKTLDVPIVTTAWVLTELANGLSGLLHRRNFIRILNSLRSDSDTTFIPPSQALFEKGVELYTARMDKEWSLTDCISFVVMKDYGLTEALTGDRHFEQMGFIPLLAEDNL